MDTTTRGTGRWVERPWAARVVRVAVYAIPLAMSILTSIVLTERLDAPLSVTWSVLRWVLIVALSTGVLVGAERVSRRLLPLATLLKLSLAFPDKVPSRFGVALRIGTTTQLQQRIENARRGEIADSPDEAAEQLLVLVGLLSHHDRLTRGHSERVRAYTHLVGVEMGIEGEELDRLRWSALLHDVGKIAIPGAILNKPGRLTDEEFDTIKTHPEVGRQLVAPLAEWLGESVRAVWEHHERVDGGGYPQGLRGAEISLAARIVCVTDSFDVMTSTRSYKQPMTAAAARAELTRCAGTQFDTRVVKAFVAASIGTTQAATKPLAMLAQLLLFPRTFLANSSALLGAAAALSIGAVAGSVGQSVAAERPATTLVQAAPRSLASAGTPDVSVDPAAIASSLSDDPTSSPVTTLSTSVPTTLERAAGDPDGPVAPGNDVTPVGDAGPDGDGPDGPTSTGTTSTTTVVGVPVPPTTRPPLTTMPPNPTVPGATTPGTLLPGVSLPGVSLPGVTVLTVPSLSVPIVDVTLPPVVVTVPPISIPPLTVPPITVPPVTLPPITVPPVTLPPITVPPLLGGLL